jgi:hypothetical protein
MRLTVADIERLNKEVEEAEVRALKRIIRKMDNETVDREFDRIMRNEIRDNRNLIRGCIEEW